MALLPTPTVNDAKNGRNRTAGRTDEHSTHHDGVTLSDVAHVRDWGKYEPAIRRHEHTFGRCAPNPLDDRGRLNPPFVEWMMGLPAGHVTGLGLPRTAELKILGNGVVRQQARAALQQLLGAVA